ncbi:MAG: PD-(D/E)XK nuclease family transposase [Bacteroidetes bacterium]|uniref:PD-(D/E)XK nuclease family transposase n=1 Tax=Candidatus Cryptobacteroides merdigallinarum TaxID=2840770 RepID=A0A9D9EK68_9BACT|nr:PD-(D/E)XK nuclease family transposase [Candidatus Cryptobacteroides merdigallinarum]
MFNSLHETPFSLTIHNFCISCIFRNSTATATRRVTAPHPEISGNGPTYADILSDAGFKAVFGEPRNKDILAELLNVLLPPDRRVKDITFSSTEIPGLTFANKSVRLVFHLSIER